MSADLNSASPVQIIVPVFNAHDVLDNCLASVYETTGDEVEICLIDDASTDQRIRPLLSEWQHRFGDRCRLFLQDKNQGFVATVNYGMRETTGDVVLLNSDTQVTTGWLQALSRCLQTDQDIATITPWSNNGEIVSIPEFCHNNPVPGQPDKVAVSIQETGQPQYPDIPTAVGFCMYITRQAIDQLGLFDEVVFGKGYGEENDFSMRVRNAGLRNVLCDDAYVVHYGGQSFGPLGLKPDEEAMSCLLGKHPDYLKLIQVFIEQDPLAARRQQILSRLTDQGVDMG